MATDKLFTVVGVSTSDGETKVRFANDIMRVKVLSKHGHTDIRLIELENAMSKLDAAMFIRSLDEFQDSNSQAAIDDYIDRNTKTVKEPKEKKAKKVPAVTKVEPADIPQGGETEDFDDDKPIGFAELAETLDDAPF